MLEWFLSFVSTGASPLLLMVLLPMAFGLLIWLCRKNRGLFVGLTAGYALLQLAVAVGFSFSQGGMLVLPFTGGGVELRFFADDFARLFLLLTAGAYGLVSLYGAGFLQGRAEGGRYMLYLGVSLGLINGAMLSDNLACMLFFWEGLLCTLLLLLLINNRERPKTAVKALVIGGLADLMLMGGIILTGVNAGTFTLSALRGLPLTGTGGLAFALMFLGAVGKAGCMPFHSWIPDAANDAPTPFLAAFPGALEKFLGMYLAARLVKDVYAVAPGSTMSLLIMILGVVTLLLAVGMALIQKDMKRLLAYHAVSQVGYMVLGIGTCLPVGIAGGLFHMLNHVVYKSCLFMTAGAVEKRAGTTDARRLGGLAKLMPITAACFVIAGLSIAGVPPFNGFFSKELIFDAVLESGVVFYIGALLGAVMTAISFLKLGRAVFFGPIRLPEAAVKDGKKTGVAMLIPMAVLAALCLLLGLCNTLPLDGLFAPALGYEQSFSGWPHSFVLVAVSVAALLLALADHCYGYRKTGSAIAAADHIHEAPVLRTVYHWAEQGRLDPYVWLNAAAQAFGKACVWIERGVSWFYDKGLVGMAKGTGNLLSRADNGMLSRYIGWALLGLSVIVAVFAALAR